MKALEEILASDPNNYKANEFLGEDIYDALNPKDEKTPLPANTDALETKMINVFTKASAAEPNNEIPLLNLGNYFINKSIKIDKDRKDLNAELKTKYKPGTPVSKEDAAKRDALDKKYLDVLEEARPRYEKTVDIFKARATLTITQKAQYKSIVTSLSDIALYKQTYYRGKPSEVAKYTAEQKKWDALYETISSNPTNNTPTTSSIKGQANFIREGKLMKIKSKINGLSLDMIFDTGASDVSISLTEALFMLKNGYLDSDDIIGKSSFSTADGSIGDGYTLNIRQLEFGGIILKNIKATVVKTLDAPILLGQSALQSFGKITIDNNKSVIVLQ